VVQKLNLAINQLLIMGKSFAAEVRNEMEELGKQQRALSLSLHQRYPGRFCCVFCRSMNTSQWHTWLSLNVAPWGKCH